MTKKKFAVVTVSYVLALLYAVSFFYYIRAAAIASVFYYNLICAFMFFILFIGSIALALGRRWGREILVYGNMVFFMMGMWLLILFPELVQFQRFDEGIFFQSVMLGGLFLAVIISAYFAQNHIRLIIQPDWKFSRKSILVVDDDEGIQMTLKRVLLDHGYSVLSATSGERGIQVASAQRPDLILLDVILPGMKGRAVCAKLKEDEKTKDIPVLFLTAKDSPDDIQAEISAGAIGHMTKPVAPKVLLSEIKRILG